MCEAETGLHSYEKNGILRWKNNLAGENDDWNLLSGLPDPRPEIIKRLVGDIHYLHFGCMLFIITLVVTVVVSLITEPMDKDYVI